HQIELLGITKEVLAAVSDETRAELENPPPASSWIDAMVIEEMIAAVDSVRGLYAVRKVTRDGQMAAIAPLLQPVLSGLLRLFGTSPLTLLQRFAQLSSRNVRGLELEWTTDSERGGRLRIKFPRKKIPRSAFVGFESGIVNLVEVCGAKAKVDDTV